MFYMQIDKDELLNQAKDLLKEEIQHFDIKKVDATEIINSMRGMSFTSRDTATAADIYDRMVNDKDCSIILTLAGSTSAAGCMQVYVDMVKNKMVDCIVSTGASMAKIHWPAFRKLPG